MYCSACGSPIASGLSYCNRCGMSLKERNESKQSGPIAAVVTAMVIVAVAAMGLLLGGAIAMKKEEFGEEFISFFMILSFFIVALTEIFLYRQLSRLTSSPNKTQFLAQSPMPHEYRSPQPQRLPEPIPSVTESTTRTLEYSREEHLK